MKILLTGGTGMIGSHLLSYFKEHEFIVPIRKANIKKSGHLQNVRYEIFNWPHYQTVKGIEDIDGVINLAGESVADRIWTKKQMARLLESRVVTTNGLVAGLKFCGIVPKFFISASAVGVYASESELPFIDENSRVGDSFLSKICLEWEQAAARQNPTRPIIFRLGNVLSKNGGLARKLSKIYKFKIPFYPGKVDHRIPWIYIDDLMELFSLAIQGKLSGVINAVSGGLTTNSEFYASISRTLRIRAMIPISPQILKLLMPRKSELFIKDLPVISSNFEVQSAVKYRDISEVIGMTFG